MPPTYFLGVNLFADLTFAQFVAQSAGLGTFALNNLGGPPEKATVGALPADIERPREVDWSTGQCVTPVTDQKCESCAAHVREGLLGTFGIWGLGWKGLEVSSLTC